MHIRSIAGGGRVNGEYLQITYRAVSKSTKGHSESTQCDYVPVPRVLRLDPHVASLRFLDWGALLLEQESIAGESVR